MKYTLILILLVFLNNNNDLYSSSKYKLSTGIEIPIITGIVLAGSTSFLVQEKEARKNIDIDSLNRWKINFFDRSATDNWSESATFASDILLGFMLIAPIGMAAENTISNKAGTYLTIYAESQLLNSTSTYLLKNIFKRKRPLLYNPDVPINKKLENDAIKSFPSGHTSTAFCSAVFVASTYEGYKLNPNYRGLVWATGLTLATTTAILRYFAGKHYPSDIITGAILGGAIGYFMPKLHETDTNNEALQPVYFITFNIGL